MTKKLVFPMMMDGQEIIRQGDVILIHRSNTKVEAFLDSQFPRRRPLILMWDLTPEYTTLATIPESESDTNEKTPEAEAPEAGIDLDK